VPITAVARSIVEFHDRADRRGRRPDHHAARRRTALRRSDPGRHRHAAP